MMSPGLGEGRRTLLLVTLAIAGIAVTLRADLSSEARANRLHRSDRLVESRALYEELVAADPSSARLRYNLGTTLLRTDEPTTFVELAAGTNSDDTRVRVRALYNMGLWSLIRSIFAEPADSAIFHATRAIEANKDALRLDPEHRNARWNLALAQRILATAQPELGADDPGDINGPDNIGDWLESPSPRDLAEREGFEESNAPGEEEARAGDDLQPLSPTEANRILGSGHLDPSTMIDKLLNREGRARRRQGIYTDGPPW